MIAYTYCQVKNPLHQAIVYMQFKYSSVLFTLNFALGYGRSWPLFREAHLIGLPTEQC